MEKFFVEHPIEHRLVPRLPVCNPGGGAAGLAGCLLKFFQREFDVDPARTLEQDRVASLRNLRHMTTGLHRIVEKKRGAGPKACTHGCVQRATGGAAYSDEHVDPL